MAEEKKGFFRRLVSGLTKTRQNIVSGLDSLFHGFSSIDEEFYEELEEILIMGDLGVNKKNLMEELKKINRVIEREYPDAYRETLVVLDGTTGQNALSQAKQFAEAAEITGIVLTKMDGTAKGGIVVAIQSELGIPVKYIGVGETIDDLQKFDPDDFVNALFTADSHEEDGEEE